ncbi:MAG: SPOR domain-containing protein [Neisseria sp.]|nr:SPOR domain-containing protein [Neisseria sp.]
MSKRKQAGKGISGFITGILLATVVIAGVLFLLNKSRQSDFKEVVEPADRDVQTEILTPHQPDTVLQPLEMQASGNFIEIMPPEQPQDISSQEPEVTVAAKSKEPEISRDRVKKDESKVPVKPTPEQILESGNIEKARSKAESEQRTRAAQEAEHRRVQAILNGKTGGVSAESGEKDGKVLIQAGSYSSKNDAESQRAKLAILGVNTHIVQAQINGKTVYRVQTGGLKAEAAAKIRRTLQKNGIESFTRSAK